MASLKNFREVGIFDVLIAPLNPIGAFNAEQFKADALSRIEQGSKYLVVDLGNLDFLYSDAFNAFLIINTKLEDMGGHFGILSNNQTVIKSLQKSGVDRVVKIFLSEGEIMSQSLESMHQEERQLEQSDAETLSAPVRTSVRSKVADDTTSTEPNTGEQPRRHRFTQSFNSTLNAEDAEADLKGMRDPFQSLDASIKASKAGLWMWIFMSFFIIAGLVTAWILLNQ